MFKAIAKTVLASTCLLLAMGMARAQETPAAELVTQTPGMPYPMFWVSQEGVYFVSAESPKVRLGNWYLNWKPHGNHPTKQWLIDSLRFINTWHARFKASGNTLYLSPLRFVLFEIPLHTLGNPMVPILTHEWFGLKALFNLAPDRATPLRFHDKKLLYLEDGYKTAEPPTKGIDALLLAQTPTGQPDTLWQYRHKFDGGAFHSRLPYLTLHVAGEHLVGYDAWQGKLWVWDGALNLINQQDLQALNSTYQVNTATGWGTKILRGQSFLAAPGSNQYYLFTQKRRAKDFAVYRLTLNAQGKATQMELLGTCAHQGRQVLNGYYYYATSPGPGLGYDAIYRQRLSAIR